MIAKDIPVGVVGLGLMNTTPNGPNDKGTIFLIADYTRRFRAWKANREC
jgi:hypothetical protein